MALGGRFDDRWLPELNFILKCDANATVSKVVLAYASLAYGVSGSLVVAGTESAPGESGFSGARVDRRGRMFALRSLLLAAALTCVFTERSPGAGAGPGPPPPAPPPQPQIGPAMIINTADNYNSNSAALPLFPPSCGCGFQGTGFTVPTPTQTLQLLGVPDEWQNELRAMRNQELNQIAQQYFGKDYSELDGGYTYFITQIQFWLAQGYPPSLIKGTFLPQLGCTISNNCQPQGAYNLGMYISQPPTPLGDGWDGAGNGSVLRSSGYRFTDSAGVLAPGTKGPGIRDVGGGGSIFGTIEATRFLGLPANQSLMLTGYFNNQYDSLNVASAPAAALHADGYAFGGDVFWRVGSSYLDGSAAYNFDHDQLNSGTGSVNAHGYFVDARIGNMFALWTTAGPPNPAAIPTKAPPKPTTGSIVGLDLSGHIGYAASELVDRL